MDDMNKSSESAHAERTSASVKQDVGKKDVRGNRIVTVVRWLSILLILASLLLIVRALPTGQAIEAMKGWIGGLGIWGPMVLALVYVVVTVLFVPGAILTLAAGALFGLVVGTITSTLGASPAFLIARSIWPVTRRRQWLTAPQIRRLDAETNRRTPAGPVDHGHSRRGALGCGSLEGLNSIANKPSH